MANGQKQNAEAMQQPGSAAGLAGGEQGEGYEPYRRDILADVARKQREHLLGAKIGAIAAPLHPVSSGSVEIASDMLDPHAWIIWIDMS